MVAKSKKWFWVKHSTLGTVLSVLVFLSISFLSYLNNIIPFDYLENDEWYHVEIGFPLTFYSEFFLDGNRSPNCGWNEDALVIDLLTALIVVITTYFILIKRLKNGATNE